MEQTLETASLVSQTDRPSLAPAPGTLNFVCNVCGARNCLSMSSIHREAGVCSNCGANVRFRSIAAILTQRLLGRTVILAELEPNPHLTGTGMSDAICYASHLQTKFNYTNTFFHCDPQMDISLPEETWLGRNDFVVSSDVFEHVAPPVQRAFDNLHGLLKPGGVVVFSVPYSLEDETREHFPNLHRFTISAESANAWVLHNETATGEVEQFRDLVFHGGPGSTLEMRLFSLAALKRHFDDAGFVDFRVHREPDYDHGIFWLEPWGITISALRPKE